MKNISEMKNTLDGINITLDTRKSKISQRAGKIICTDKWSEMTQGKRDSLFKKKNNQKYLCNWTLSGENRMGRKQ